MKRKAVKIAAAILGVAALTLAVVKLFPLVMSLTEPETREAFREFIDSLGILGVGAMLLLQTLQIVVAVIPGEPIEVLFGMMYGTLGGLALTLCGIALGQTLVFFLVRRFGVKFASRFVNVDKFRNLRFIKDAARRDALVFLLFFIPGTPKDILTYFVPFTDIPFLRFILLSTFARIPSVVSSTFAGATLSEGGLLKTVIIFAATGAVGILGIIINNKITKAKENSDDKDITR